MYIRLHNTAEEFKACLSVRYLKGPAHAHGEIKCFRNSEKLRKPDNSKFRCVFAGRFRRETCTMKMETLFRVSPALPLT